MSGGRRTVRGRFAFGFIDRHKTTLKSTLIVRCVIKIDFDVRRLSAARAQPERRKMPLINIRDTPAVTARGVKEEDARMVSRLLLDREYYAPYDGRS